MAEGDIRIDDADLAKLTASLDRFEAAAASASGTQGLAGGGDAETAGLLGLFDEMQRMFDADVHREGSFSLLGTDLGFQETRQAIGALQGAAGGLGVGLAAGLVTLNPAVGLAVGGVGAAAGAVLGYTEEERRRDLSRTLAELDNRVFELEQQQATLSIGAQDYLERLAAQNRARGH